MQSGVSRKSNNRYTKGSSDFVPVDSLIRKQNLKETLQYFSNMSTVREACTKQHLDEFIELLQRSKENEVLNIGSMCEQGDGGFA